MQAPEAAIAPGEFVNEFDGADAVGEFEVDVFAAADAGAAGISGVAPGFALARGGNAAGIAE